MMMGVVCDGGTIHITYGLYQRPGRCASQKRTDIERDRAGRSHPTMPCILSNTRAMIEPSLY
jgi:hypothetical protein